MKRSSFVLCLLALVVLSTAACARVTVEKIRYRGWWDSYRMTAGDYSLVVVPEIGGRIMEYSLAGENVMWENPEEFGSTYSVADDWKNYGGYKTWVSPQDAWTWPPDFMMESGKANVEVLQDPKGLPLLKVIGAPSPKVGAYFIKEITLAENGEVRIKQRMRNISPKSVHYGIWDVTQVRTPCFVAFPLNPSSKFKDGLNCITAESRNSVQYSSREGICIVDYKGEVTDVASDSPGPWMIWFQGDLAYVKLFGPPEKGAEYPWNGCTCEVFTSKAQLGYVEMEIHGPLTTLGPGEETDTAGKWRLFRLTQPVNSPDRVIKAVKGMRGKGMIP